MPTPKVDAKAHAMLSDGRVTIHPHHVEVRGAHGTYEITYRGDSWRCLCASRLKACSHIVAAQIALARQRKPTMTDPFAPQIEAVQERILTFGAAGSGKSTAWLSTAKWLQEQGSTATFWVLDTDRAASRMLAGVKFAGLTNIKVAVCRNWPELVAATDAALDRARAGDWLVVDMVDKVWEYAQAHFVNVMHGVDMEAYLLTVRKALGANSKNLKPFEGMIDWPVINGMYKGWSDRTLMNDRGIHVFGVTPMKAIDERLTGDEIKEAFGNLGVYPSGQKHLAHQFHTVLLMSQAKGNKWLANTAKDRERSFLKGPLGDFAADYMVAVADFSGQPDSMPQPAPVTAPPAVSGPVPPTQTAAPPVDFNAPAERTAARLDDPPPPEEPVFHSDGTPANVAAQNYNPPPDEMNTDTVEQLEIAEGLIALAEVPEKYQGAIESWTYLRTWLSTALKMKPSAQDALRIACFGVTKWVELTQAQLLVIAWAAEAKQAEVPFG